MKRSLCITLPLLVMFALLTPAFATGASEILADLTWLLQKQSTNLKRRISLIQVQQLLKLI